MKIKKRTFTITRNGYFSTDKFTAFQCTIEGWTHYRYELALTGSPKWDKQGFLVDHNMLHEAILKYIEEHPMQSCELVLENLCNVIIEQCKKNKVELKRIELALAPVHPDDLHMKGGQLRRWRMNGIEMPAFGRFICEF